MKGHRRGTRPAGLLSSGGDPAVRSSILARSFSHRANVLLPSLDFRPVRVIVGVLSRQVPVGFGDCRRVMARTGIALFGGGPGRLRLRLRGVHRDGDANGE